MTAESLSHDPAFAVEVDRASPADWAALLSLFDDATLYQTWAYGRVSWGGRQLSHIVLTRDGRPVAAAQVRIVSLPLVRRGVAYVRWGPLWRRRGVPPDPLILRRMAEALRGEYVARRRLLLRVMPNVFAGDEEAAAVKECWESAGLSAAGGPAYRTLRLDASPPLDALRKGLDQKWRNQLNRAEKNGLTVVEGSGDDLYALFRRLYAEMYARKRFETSISVEAFGRIQEGLEPALKMQIFICKAQDEPVSALVGSALGDTGIYLLGATSDSGLQAKGAYLLQWCMLRWLKERGCRFYDLGGINPERNPGVYHFKSGLCGADVTHLGRFEASGSALSAFCVRRAEQLQNAARALRAAARP